MAIQVENTLDDNLLRNISVEVFNKSEENDFNLSKIEVINIDSLAYNEKKSFFLKLLSNGETTYPMISFQIKLNYEVQELDSRGQAHGDIYRDLYQVDKRVEVKYSDFLFPSSKITEENFEQQWGQCGNSNFNKTEEKFKLPYPNIRKAAQEISKILGLSPLTPVDKVDKTANKYEFNFAYSSIFDTMVCSFD